MTLGMKRRPGQIRDYGFPVLKNTQIEQADAEAIYEPGIIIAVKNGDNWSLASYCRLDNNGCSQGEALVTNYATLAQYGVAKAATDDGKLPNLRGIAAATIASQKYGWMYIAGYVEKADLSHTAASGEMLTISGSTAGKLSPDGASSVLNATLPCITAATLPWPVAVARTAIATGVGSISILGMWG